MGFALLEASWYRTSLKSFMKRRPLLTDIGRGGVQAEVPRVHPATRTVDTINHVAVIWSPLELRGMVGEMEASGECASILGAPR
jgi:hypothetical protein